MFVDFLGKKDFPETVVGIGIKNRSISQDIERKLYDRIAAWKISQVKMDRWLEKKRKIRPVIKRFIPSVLIDLYRRRHFK